MSTQRLKTLTDYINAHYNSDQTHNFILSNNGDEYTVTPIEGNGEAFSGDLNLALDRPGTFIYDLSAHGVIVIPDDAPVPNNLVITGVNDGNN